MKYTVSLLLIIVLTVGCDEEPAISIDQTELVTVEGWEKFTDVISGTYYRDSTYWLVSAAKMTRTAGSSRHLDIYIKKDALRQQTFPFTLRATDFELVQTDRQDDAVERVKIIEYDGNASLIINDIKSSTIFATFSGWSQDGLFLTGEFSGFPLDFECLIGPSYSLPCPITSDYTKPVIFSVPGQDDLEAVDSKAATIYAYFIVPPDTNSLKQNFKLLENNGKPVEGRLKIRSRTYIQFYPSQPLKRGTTYTAKFLKGLRNTVSDLILPEDHELVFKTSCANPPVGDKLLNMGITVQLGDSLSVEQGNWSIVEGPGGEFSDNISSYSKFTGTERVVYKLRWTPSGTCAATDIFVDLTPTVADYEGNLYHTVTLGDQTWLAENLRSQKDAEGRAIPENKVHGDILTNGRYYPWWVAMNESDSSSSIPSGIQGICPNGWHLPSIKEFQVLLDFAATDGRPVHLLLKDTATWDNALDIYGFNVVRTGNFDRRGGFTSGETLFWTTNKVYTSHVSALVFLTDKVVIKLHHDYQSSGSVRCLKD